MANRTTADKYLNELRSLSDKGNGSFGAFFISDTDSHTCAGGWNAITMIENTNFNVLTNGNWSGDDPTGEVFPEGLTIYGNFTTIDLTSGACIAYFASTDNTVT